MCGWEPVRALLPQAPRPSHLVGGLQMGCDRLQHRLERHDVAPAVGQLRPLPPQRLLCAAPFGIGGGGVVVGAAVVERRVLKPWERGAVVVVVGVCRAGQDAAFDV